jgi:hypothetical protein
MHRFDGSPMIQPILFKSAVYWFCVLIVRLAEGLIHFLMASVPARTVRYGRLPRCCGETSEFSLWNFRDASSLCSTSFDASRAVLVFVSRAERIVREQVARDTDLSRRDNRQECDSLRGVILIPNFLVVCLVRTGANAE